MYTETVNFYTETREIISQSACTLKYEKLFLSLPVDWNTRTIQGKCIYRNAEAWKDYQLINQIRTGNKGKQVRIPGVIKRNIFQTG